MEDDYTISQKIDTIKETLLNMTKEEYQKNNYTPEEKTIRTLKDKTFERDANLEISRLNSKMYEIAKKKERSSKNTVASVPTKDELSTSTATSTSTSTLTSTSTNVSTLALINMSNNRNGIIGTMDITVDGFNVISEEKIYIEWKKIEISEKLLILEKYFDDDIENPKFNIPFSAEIKDKIIQLINENNLLTKKDILYDKVNKKILDIPLIKFQNGIFELKRDEKKINIRKNNIKNINKILQKN